MILPVVGLLIPVALASSARLAALRPRSCSRIVAWLASRRLAGIAGKRPMYHAVGNPAGRSPLHGEGVAPAGPTGADRATSKMANESAFATDVTTIAAGGRFVFSATYMDSRL